MTDELKLIIIQALDIAAMNGGFAKLSTQMQMQILEAKGKLAALDVSTPEDSE